MVTYKVLLDTRRAKADGTYAVQIRITNNRVSTTSNTGVFIEESHWNESQLNVQTTHPNAQLLNRKITESYLKVQKVVLELENEDVFSFEALKERLASSYKTQHKTRIVNFKAFAEQLVEDMFSVNQAGNAIVYRTTINRFNGYAGNPKLRFTDIDYNLLEGFKRHLLKDGVKQNTVSNYFRTLRAIYNKAIKAKLVDRSHYPFLDIAIKTERTAKRAITLNDLQALANIELKPRTKKWQARNYFFLSFALIGASFTDLAYLTQQNIHKGRLTYRRRKTGKELSIRLLPYTEALFANYKDLNCKYLLPIVHPSVIEDSMRAKALITQWIKTTNKWLRKIIVDSDLDCDLTTYVARHTWATTAKRLGYSIELIAEAMGHEHGNKITNIYLDSFDQNEIDDMNNRVIKCIE